LQGDPRGSVSHARTEVEDPLIPHNPSLNAAQRLAMQDSVYVLTEERRALVADAFGETCAAREWTLLAMHVRSNHVHLVIQSRSTPERIMRDLKSYASRRLAE